MTFSTFVARYAEKRLSRSAYFLPPCVVDSIKWVLAEWEYLPGGWSDDHTRTKGWNDQSVADAQAAHWPTLVANTRGTGPLGVSHFPWSTTREDGGDHNTMMSYGYVLALVARKKEGLSVLDWGGGAGHYYLYSRALLPDVALEYHCHDLPALCQLGRRMLPDIQFHENADQVLTRQYELVISSSSLHYFKDWRAVLQRLAAASADFLYIARLQTVYREPSFVVIQRPHRHGYNTEYLSWFVNRHELLSCAAECGLDLIREFVFVEEWVVKGAPEKAASRGFLFQRRPK